MKKTTRCIIYLWMTIVGILVFLFSASAETDGIFTYTVSNNEAAITEIAFSGQTEIWIPETLGGATVTTLGEYMLRDATYELGDDTVNAVYLPKTVTNVSISAFSYADLAHIYVDTENPNYSNDAFGILFNKDKTELIKAPCCLPETAYTVPNSVSTLSQYAFEGVIFLQDLLLPDGLTGFGQQAFYEMSSLKSIALPEGITAIGLNDFAYCTSMTSVSLPSSLRTIAGSAFTECYALKEVIVPEGVTSIGTYAFESDTSLERIVLPASLQTVGRAICGNCPNLAHVYYAGSADEWAALNVQTGSYYGSRVDAFDVAAFHYNFDATPYETLTVKYDNDLLTISGSGSIPAADTDTFQFWDEHKDTVTALFLEDHISQIGSHAFQSFPNLRYVIIDTETTALADHAFSDCASFDSLLFFGNASINTASVDSDAEYLQVFIPKNRTLSGDVDPSRMHIIPFSYESNTLALDGSVTWDGYQFLDTMTAFCLHFDPIDVLKCTEFTFNALPLYGTNNDGDYEAIEENRLTEAELRAQAGDADSISYNALVTGIVDGSITSFRLIAKDSEHEEIKDTPVEIKEENDSGFGGFIRKAIKWVVRLLDTFLNIISKLKKK